MLAQRAFRLADSEAAPSAELGDLRFRALVSESEWTALPVSIRRRFSKRLAGGRTIVYAGEILETWMSAAGYSRRPRASLAPRCRQAAARTSRAS